MRPHSIHLNFSKYPVHSINFNPNFHKLWMHCPFMLILIVVCIVMIWCFNRRVITFCKFFKNNLFLLLITTSSPVLHSNLVTYKTILQFCQIHTPSFAIWPFDVLKAALLLPVTYEKVCYFLLFSSDCSSLTPLFVSSLN